MKRLSFKEKQELIRLCSDLSTMEETDIHRDKPFEDTEQEKDDEAEEEEAEESVLMSQGAWNENLDQYLEPGLEQCEKEFEYVYLSIDILSVNLNCPLQYM